MRSVACVGLALTGCFYTDPINRPPEIDGFECTMLPSNQACGINSTGIVDGYFARGATIELKANITDPEGHEAAATYTWDAFRCDESDAKHCDTRITDDALTDDNESSSKFLKVPSDLAAGIRAIRLELQVRDDRGAFSSRSLSFLVNDPPTLALDSAPHDNVVGAPIAVFAKYGDLDDGPSNVTLQWDVRGPDMQSVTLDPLDVPPDLTDPAHATIGKQLVPTSVGDWSVTVTATDAIGAQLADHRNLTVGPDEPPCIARVAPVVPPDGARLPITEPTVFQVALVDDVLDPYPPVSSDPHFGTTTFAWSILRPGDTVRQPLATANSVDLDPSEFTPGDVIELRVEIFDRNHTAIPCADDVPTCSLTQADCIQRQTWQVEAR